MKKNKLFMIIVLIVTFIMLIGMTTRVFADAIDLNGNGGTDTDPNIPDISFTPETPADPDPDPETPADPEQETPADPETETQNPGSTYPESTMPNAGIEDSILMVAAFVACAIIGIYTFMKLSEYSNI